MAECYYLLPSHPTIVCEDRFSILDTEELYVPFWDLLGTVLNDSKVDSVTALIEILETISVVRRGRSDSDYGFLTQYLSNLELRDQFFGETWPQLKILALEMPVLFPGSRIPILGRGETKLVFSRRQIACLVVHQFLCTLTAPPWQDGFQDFHIWYSSEQPHAKAIDAYLTALFEYFFRFTAEDECSPLRYNAEEWAITYALHTYSDDQTPERKSIPLTDLKVLKMPEPTTAPSVIGLPDGATVISANKFIGFGRTGTQEEMHVGASPECCPAVLITPPLTDDQALVVTGPEAMVAVAGYQRDARCAEILRPDTAATAKEHAARWKRRTMLFMDALELDLADRDAGLPDLHPGNVDREFRKAVTAFSSYRQSDRSPYATINTGYWGCGTFGGNVVVKSLIQWCAASLAGCNLTFLCFGEVHGALGDQLKRFVDEVKEQCSATEIMMILQRLQPEEAQLGDSVFETIKSRLKR